MNWPDPSPAQSLSLVVGQVVGGDLVIKESLVSLLATWNAAPQPDTLWTHLLKRPVVLCIRLPYTGLTQPMTSTTVPPLQFDNNGILDAVDASSDLDRMDVAFTLADQMQAELAGVRLPLFTICPFLVRSSHPLLPQWPCSYFWVANKMQACQHLCLQPFLKADDAAHHKFPGIAFV